MIGGRLDFDGGDSLIAFRKCRAKARLRQPRPFPISVRRLVNRLVDRQRAQESQSLSEQRYRHLIEQAPIGILTFNNQGSIREVNAAMVTLLGSPSAAATRAINVLTFPLLVESGISADFHQCLQSGQPGVFERRYTSKWGKRIYLRYHLGPLFDRRRRVIGVQAVMEDFTRRLEAERAVFESERRFREMAELLPDMIYETDASDRVSYVNRAFLRTFGYDRAAVEGKVNLETFMDLNQDNPTVALMKTKDRSLLLAAIEKRGQRPFSLIAQRKDGTTFPCEVKSAAIRNTEGQFLGFRGTVRDISDRVDAITELQQLHEQSRADAKTRALLLSEVNHRVKNNLAGIIGMLYTTRRFANQEGSPVDFNRAVDSLISRIEGMASVHELLSATMWSPVSLKELISRIVHPVLQNLPFETRAEIHIEAEDDIRILPKQTNTLGMIFNEVATNTVKHASTGRTTVQIQVAIRRQDNEVLLDCRDDGPGFPDTVLIGERIGLGLYLTKTLVKDGLQGSLCLMNDAGAVTRIRFKPEALDGV
jgi:PAS domain S-box-containing protein